MKKFTLLFLLLLSSCMPYKVNKSDWMSKQKFDNEQERKINNEAMSHPLYTVIPREYNQIYWFDAPHWISWSLLGNDADGIFGEDFDSNFTTDYPIGYKRYVQWYTRNPLHNFTHYVIGTAYIQNSEYTLLQYDGNRFSGLNYDPIAKTVFASLDKPSFYFGLHGWKPFLSIGIPAKRSFGFYIGWREQGNFGIKLRFSKDGI